MADGAVAAAGRRARGQASQDGGTRVAGHISGWRAQAATVQGQRLRGGAPASCWSARRRGLPLCMRYTSSPACSTAARGGSGAAGHSSEGGQQQFIGAGAAAQRQWQRVLGAVPPLQAMPDRTRHHATTTRALLTRVVVCQRLRQVQQRYQQLAMRGVEAATALCQRGQRQAHQHVRDARQHASCSRVGAQWRRAQMQRWQRGCPGLQRATSARQHALSTQTLRAATPACQLVPLTWPPLLEPDEADAVGEHEGGSAASTDDVDARVVLTHAPAATSTGSSGQA